MKRQQKPNINVVDLFAGPGGLGEGFSAFSIAENVHPFQIQMSVEKDASAHATLTLRAFLRQFGNKSFPTEYESFLKGEITQESLFALHPQQARSARKETMETPVELGRDNPRILKRIDELLSGARDSPWVVIGGPPCQAYSLVGRSRNQGKKNYQPESDERNFLYREYLRILTRVRPEIFVMENVRGILSAKVHGRRIFEDILSDLHCPSQAISHGKDKSLKYEIHSLVVDSPSQKLAPKDYLIRSELYGVPQARHRVILLGIRSDLPITPSTLKPSQGVTVSHIISQLPPIRSRLSRGRDSADAWGKAIQSCIMQTRESPEQVPDQVREVMYSAASSLKRDLPVSSNQYTFGGPTFHDEVSKDLITWLSGQSNYLDGHIARSHMPEDLARYFFAACWSEAFPGLSPKAKDYPDFLTPNHANWTTGKFADRFRVQSWSRPSSTVTSHISKDGHYFIHPDPIQCRSLTPREAARLQTFPDDYHFMGNRTQQYHQIGNAVPPWLAHQIAEIVYRSLF